MIAVQCSYCGRETLKAPSAVNRARAAGLSLYCDLKCTGMARRRKVPLTLEQLKARKAEYDRERRTKLADRIRAEKHAAYLRDREKRLAQMTEYRNRPENVARHNAYCRRAEYVAQKREYDRRLRATKQFGDAFADAFLVLQDLEREIDARASRYDIYMANGTINKAQTRKRAIA